MTAETEQKLADMEALIAHQDKQVQELNDIVTRQWTEIDQLKKYLKLTRDKMQELEHSVSEISGGEGISVSDEAAANKPPHY